MSLQFDEEDRIEHIHGFSHCRCKNTILINGNHSCSEFEIDRITEKSRKHGLREHQQCMYSTDQGYCQFSRLDEVLFIKSKPKSELPLIAERITTEIGIKFLQEAMRP